MKIGIKNIISSALILLALSSCTILDIEQLGGRTGYVDGNGYIIYDNDNNGVKTFDFSQKIAKTNLNLNFVTKYDNFNNIKNVNINGQIRNNNSFPIKVVVRIPIIDNFDRITHTITHVESIDARSYKNINQTKSVPNFVSGKVYKNGINVDISEVNVNSNNSLRNDFSNINYEVKTDSFGYARNLRIYGEIRNPRNYKVKAVIYIPIKDSFGSTVKTLTLDKEIEAYSKAGFNNTFTISNFINGTINNQDINVKYFKLSNSQNSYNEDKYGYNEINETYLRRNIRIDEDRDYNGYALSIKLSGRVRNNSNRHLRVYALLPIVNANGRTIYTVKWERTLNANAEIEIDDTLKLPHNVVGYLDRRNIKIDLYRDGQTRTTIRKTISNSIF